MNENKKNGIEKYISLREAARLYGCTQRHMNLMSRQGRLKAVKLGRNWVTTLEWLKEYIETVKYSNGRVNGKVKTDKPKTEKLVKVKNVFSYKKLVLRVAVAILVFLFISVVYASAKQGALFSDLKSRAERLSTNILESYNFTFKSAKDSVSESLAFTFKSTDKIKNIIFDNLLASNVFSGRAVIETENVLASILEMPKSIGLDVFDNISNTVKTMARGYRITDKKLNQFFSSLFGDVFDDFCHVIDTILTSSGNFAMNVIYFSYKGTSNLVKNTPTFVSNTIRFISLAPSNIKKQVVSLFPLFSPFSSYSSFDSQTIISIKDIYSKLNNLRDYVSGKTILVHEQSRDIVREITIIQPKQTIETTIKSAISLADFKNELLTLVDSKLANMEGTIIKNEIISNNYYYSEAAKIGGFNTVNNEVDFNENVDMAKNLTVVGNIIGGNITGSTITGTSFTDSTLTITGGNITGGDYLSFTNASISENLDVTGDVSISGNLNAGAISYNTASVSDDFEVGDNIFYVNVGSQSYNFGGTGTASFVGPVNIANDLDVDNGTLWIDSSDNAVGIGGDYAPSYTLSVDGTTSISDNFYLGNDMLWSEISADYLYSSASWNIFGNLDLDGTASISGSLTVPTLTTTNFSTTHASISDDFETSSANITSASFGTIYGGTWNGNRIDISDYTNLSASNPLSLVGDNLTIDYASASGPGYLTQADFLDFDDHVASTNAHIDWTKASSSFFTTESLEVDNTVSISGAFTLGTDVIQESAIDLNTSCAAGSHLYISGNDFACEPDANTTYTAASPLSLVGTEFDIDLASTSGPGYLSNTDWDTFSAKQAALTFQLPLVNVSNTVSASYSSSGDSGWLSSTDWSTFNSKQGTITATDPLWFSGTTLDIDYASAGGGGYLLVGDFQDFDDHVASTNAHIDWTVDQGATNIDAGNYIDTNTTYTAGDHLTLTLTDFDVDDDFLLNTGDTGTWVSVSEGFEAASGIITSLSATTLNFPIDSVQEADIDMDTPCAAGSHLYVNGNDFACEADANTTYTFELPLVNVSNVISASYSSAGDSGWLSSTDWSTFNSKQGTMTASDPLSIIGANLSIDTASTGDNGVLTSTDWNTFNNKLDQKASTSFIWSPTGGNTFEIDGLASVSGNIDLNSVGLALNIGNSGTDFTSTGGLTLAGDFSGTYASLSQDFQVGTNNLYVNVGSSSMDLLRASVSDSLTVGDIMHANILTDGTATLTGGAFTGLSSLTSTLGTFTHASISDDFEAASANIASASIGTLNITTLSPTNLSATHASISDDLTIGTNTAFRDGYINSATGTLSINTGNNQPVTFGTGLLSFTRASVSDSLTVSDALRIGQSLTVADTLTKAYSSFGSNTTNHGLTNAYDALFSGNVEIDGTLYLDGSTIEFPQASVSDDFQVGGVIKLSDGSAINPSYTFTNDTDTGMFRGGINILGLTTAGSERLHIDASGNVGIGTSSPDYLLDVAGQITASSSYFTGLTQMTHASISDDLTISDVFTARDGLVSISDDFYVGEDSLFADISTDTIFSSSSWSILGNFDVDGTASMSALTLSGDFTGVRASISDSLTVTDIIHGGILTDGTATFTGGAFTGLSSLTSTTGLFTHASISDDFETSSAQITSASVGTLNATTLVFPNDSVQEADIDMDTVCGAGNHLYVNGNDFACEADANTTYTFSNPLSLVGTAVSIDLASASGNGYLQASDFTIFSNKLDQKASTSFIWSPTAGNTFEIDGLASVSGNIDFNSVGLAVNIGNSGTDFTSTGGLNLAGTLTMAGAIQASASFESDSTASISGAVNLKNTISCDTIDTDANGLLSCGTDDDVPEAADYSALIGGEGIDNSPTGTMLLDLTEYSNPIFASGSAQTWTIDAGGVDPLFIFNSGAFTLGSATFESDYTASLSSDWDFNSKGLLINIGNSGTDFTSGGGLNIAGTFALATDQLWTTSNTGNVLTSHSWQFSTGQSVEFDGTASTSGNWTINAGTWDFSSAGILVNIGNSATDFDSTGGLTLGGLFSGTGASLSGDLDIVGDLNVASASLGTLVVTGTSSASFAGPLTVAGDLDIQSGTLFVDDSSGYVGIGTTNPTHRLEVAGELKVTDTILIADGSAAWPGLAFNDDGANTGIFRPAEDTFGISTGGTEKLRITSTGNVGIGNTVPDKLLTVAGDILASNSYNTGGIWASGSVSFDSTASISDDFYVGGDSLIFDLSLDKFLSSSSWSTMGNWDLDGNASISGTFEGAGLVDCDLDTQTLAWDATNKVFSCGDDDTGGAGGELHGLLNSDWHPDVLTASVSVGSLIVGGETTWQELVVGASGSFAGFNGVSTSFVNQIGNLEVYGTASISSNLYVQGPSLFQANTDSITFFQIASSSRSGTDAIFNVDTTNSRVGMGTAAPTERFHFYTEEGYSNMLLESAGPSENDLILYLKRTANGSNIGDYNDIARILFTSVNDKATPESINYASILGSTDDVSDGTEDGNLTFRLMKAGTDTSVLTFEPGSSYFRTNKVGIWDNSADFGLEVAASTSNGYFAVSSDDVDDGDLFVIDENGYVGIGDTDPSYKLSVDGTASISGDTNIGDTLFFADISEASISATGAIEATGILKGSNIDTNLDLYNLYLGTNIGSTTTGSYNNFIGNYAGALAEETSNATFIGREAGRYAINADLSFFSGYNAGQFASDSHDSVFIGYNAGQYAENSTYTTFIGRDAGQYASMSSGVMIGGYHTGTYAESAGDVVFIGPLAGEYAVNSDYGVFMGYGAGQYASESINAVFMGQWAGQYAENSDYSTFIGVDAGQYASLSYASTMIGGWAGQNAGGADYVTYIGTEAGQYAGEGDNNVYLGFQAGYNASGSSNVLIGYQAGYNETGSNKLYIENSNSATPLIYGDFSGNYVSISNDLYTAGNLFINGTASISDDFYVGGDSLIFDLSLDKFLSSSSWSIMGNWDLDGTASISTALNVYGTATSSFAGGLTVAGDTNLHSGTLFVDTSSNYVGIGTTAPGVKLQVLGQAMVGGDADNLLTFNIFGTNYGHFYDINGVSSAGGVALGGSTTLLGVPTTPTMFWNVNTGNVGIGTTVASQKLSVDGIASVSGGYLSDTFPNVGTTDYLCWDSSGSSYIGDCTSSIKYKENVQDLGLGLDLVIQLQPRTFDWKTKTEDKHSLGFIAEEVEQIEPMLVVHRDGVVTSVRYAEMTALLTNAIQEMTSIIDLASAPQDSASLTIDSLGNIGIGGSASISGDLYIGGLATASNAYVYTDAEGKLHAGDAYPDLAEYMPLSSESMSYELGDVISSRPATEQDKNNGLTTEPFIGIKSSISYDQNLLGVVSYEDVPALGTKLNNNYLPVALIGRVLVKVSTENGAIEPGDYLTSSTKPGIAMKATQAGPVIGKALEVYDNSDPNQVGKILVFVNLTWYGGKSSEIVINPDGTVGGTSTISDANFASNLIAGVRQLGVDIVDGVIKASKLVVNEVKTKLFRVAIEENKDNVVGSATIPAQQIEFRVENSLVEANSKIFISFTSDTGGKSWHISEKVAGNGFTIRLSDVTPEPLSFDYWIVLVEGNETVPTAVPTQIGTEVGEPYCGDGIVNATETCDDGNNASGDGCSAGCIVEAPSGETPTEVPIEEPLPAVAPSDGAEEGVVEPLPADEAGAPTGAEEGAPEPVSAPAPTTEPVSVQ